MHLHFASSFGFDTVFPRFARDKGDTVHGHLYVGEKEFLDILELHLGAVQIDVHQALRISSYKRAIREALIKEPSLYIERSFETDAWGTAKQLLVWRDELQLGMWDFSFESGEAKSAQVQLGLFDVSGSSSGDDPSLKRLSVLAKVEAHVDDLPYGVNDRWRLIMDVIKSRTSLPIHEVTFYEPEEYIHPFFKQLSILLKEKGVMIHWHRYEYNDDDTDLGKFKLKLATSTNQTVDASGDGSLIVLQADNEQILADALCLHLDKDDDKTLLLLQERGEVLERALIQSGFPALGYMSVQRDTAVQQLITLASVFLWEPLNPEKITQFFTLQVAPIGKTLRSFLAKAFAKKQGIGNDKWEEEIGKYCETFSIEKTTVDAQINRWFDRTRHNIHQGVPKNEVIDLYEDLATWSRAAAQSHTEKENKEDNEPRQMAYLRLQQSLQNLIQLVKAEADDNQFIQEIELQKWVSSLETDTRSKAHQPQLGTMQHINHPANLTKQSVRTVWWNFLDQGNPLSHSARWSHAELEVLEDAFIHSHEQRLGLWYWQLCHAIQMTDGQLILCLPKKAMGEEKDACPLYADLTACYHDTGPLVNQIDLSAKAIPFNNKTIALHNYPKKTLPRRKATWSILVNEQLERLESESFSSLQKLFYYPYAYYLSYILNINPIEIPDTLVTPLLLGNMAHHTAELLWKDHALFEYDDAALTTVIKAAIQTIIRSEGAIFEMEKNTISRKEYISKLEKSMRHLIKEIKTNGWRFVEAEKKHEVKNHINLNGHIDLVLERNDEIAIVDLKWGGATSRRKELLEKKELQLIIYNQLLKTEDKKIYLHYYIISKSTFISHTNKAFSSAENFNIEHLNKRIHEIWLQMIYTYEERWKQLNAGTIEVGDGLHKSDIADVLAFYHDETTYLQMPVSSGKKEEDRYGQYENIIGQL